MNGSSRGQPDCVQDRLVTRAATQVSRQRLADLVVAGFRDPPQQVVRCHDQPRRAEAALHGARVDERLLHRVQLVAVGQSLHGTHRVALGLAGRDQARAHRRVVQVDRAGTAFALFAGILRAGQAESFAEHVEQALAGPDVVRGALLAVDNQVHAHAGQLPSR